MQPKKEKIDPKQNKLDSFGFGPDGDDDITEVKATNGNKQYIELVRYQPIRKLHMFNRTLRLCDTRLNHSLLSTPVQCMNCSSFKRSTLYSVPEDARKLQVTQAMDHAHAYFRSYGNYIRLTKWLQKLL